MILKDKGLEQLIGKAKFTDASDSAVLEDESARVQLRGSALPTGDLVTGIVVAVKGTAVAGGDFWVSVRPPNFFFLLSHPPNISSIILTWSKKSTVMACFTSAKK